jgi:hypothetical protein
MKAVYTKNDSSSNRKILKFLGGLFALLYALLFIPAMLFIPQLGVFSSDADKISIFGVVLCVLVFVTIPLSMPYSIYLIYKCFVRARYGQMLFFCLLPLLLCIIAPLLAFSIVCFYDHSLISWLMSYGFLH